jgi:hypothetical protein
MQDQAQDCIFHLVTSASLRRHEPITVTVPFARGQCASLDRLRVFDRHTRVLPVQRRPLDRWIDGSIRWAQLDFLADISTADETWQVASDADVSDPIPPVAATVAIDGGSASIDTGAVRLILNAAHAWPIVHVDRADGTPTAIARGDLRLLAPGSAAWRYAGGTLRVLEAGPIRVAISIHGSWISEARRLESEVVIEAFAGLPTLRCACRLRNPAAAAHVDGYWDLGDRGSVQLQSWTLHLAARPRRHTGPAPPVRQRRSEVAKRRACRGGRACLNSRAGICDAVG